MIRCLSLAVVAGCLFAAAPALAQAHAHAPAAAPAANDTGDLRTGVTRGLNVEIISDTEIYIDGVRFNSWDEVADAGVYRQAHARCGYHRDPDADDGIGLARDFSAADCTFNRTNIQPDYDPSVERYRIPVVVHIIQRTNGTGNISDAQAASQIDILNEDFQALAGTNGAPGTDMNVEFYLATEDPQGNPTTGITRSVNNTWFNDGGSYWNTLAWDTSRYLNIYSNSASGALGYVPNLPQGGIAGSNSDRVVVLYSTFGRNAPFSPFNLGRTGTHEVGHYFGLDHTFAGGCASASNCYQNGDLICDTNPESSPFFGCSSSSFSCGSSDPIDNYMDYSDDRCMNKFTPEQVNRMRCSLVNYRADLYEVVNDTPPCNAADIAAPAGVLDLADVDAFTGAFTSGDPAADIAVPFGFNDLSDIDAFIDLFQAGCP